MRSNYSHLTNYMSTLPNSKIPTIHFKVFHSFIQSFISQKSMKMASYNVIIT